MESPRPAWAVNGIMMTKPANTVIMPHSLTFISQPPVLALLTAHSTFHLQLDPPIKQSRIFE